MPLTFNVTRDNTSETINPLTVYLTVGGTAIFGTDYTVSGAATFTSSNASVVIPANSLSANIVVTPTSDTVVELDETVILAIASSSSVSQVGSNSSATGTILNDDVAAIASTLLLHFGGANNSTTFTDSASPPNTVTAYGTAVISTAQSKFGGSSLRLTGGSTFSAIYMTDVGSLELGGGDFTIEMFIYRLSTNGANLLLKGNGGAYSFTGALGASLVFYVGATTYSLSLPNPTLNTWKHLAITRSGNTLRCFLDGVLFSTGSVIGNINNVTDQFVLGGFSSGTVDAYIDEFRVIVGTAAYTANFTPPTAAFT